MKKAFTLVELMIVVVVIAILASVTFRIAGLGRDSSNRNITVSRLQRLENCLSGYFAAFGSYPPVELCGRSRNIYQEVDELTGIQMLDRNPDTSKLEWRRVEAACRSQPMGMSYPYSPQMYDYIENLSNLCKERYESGEVTDKRYAYGFSGKPHYDSTDGAAWTEAQIFEFGLLSYLLPRYLLMISNVETTGDTLANLYDECPQWLENNKLPCQFETGAPYERWSDLIADMNEDNGENRWKVELLPSQSITSRWLVNLEKCLCSMRPKTLYGVALRGDHHGDHTPGAKLIYSANIPSNGSQQYILDGITCNDGWGNEFYYYSPPPYQGYRLWSAGPNGKTFPPWVSPDEIRMLDAGKQKTVQDWISDDVVHMSN